MNPFEQPKPLNQGLEAFRDHLSVEYRASEKPQTLVIEAHITAIPAFATGPLNMRWLELAMGAGGAGGAEFPPSAGSVEHVSGPLQTTDEGSRGPNYRWEMRVAGVSPLFLRNIVPLFGTIGAPGKTTLVRIAGSLPLDDSPLSVREATVLRWLDDRQSFLKAWPETGFPVKTKEGTKRAATTRVQLTGPVDKKLVERLELVFSMWRSSIMSYPSLDFANCGRAQGVLQTAKTKRDVVCSYPTFNYAREPSLAVLTNMLSYFHAKVATIAEAEITLPGD